MKRQSQCDLILSVLLRKDGATAAEIHQHVGGCRLNSRIAELRTRGHHIDCEHLPGGNGPEFYLYRLLSERGGSTSNEVTCHGSVSLAEQPKIAEPHPLASASAAPSKRRPPSPTRSADQADGAAAPLQLNLLAA